MDSGLRKRHRTMWVVISIVLTVLVFLAIVLRP